MSAKRCARWGSGEDQCLLPAYHLGPCTLRTGPTLPVYHHGLPVNGCEDCGQPVAQPWAHYCTQHLAARFEQ